MQVRAPVRAATARERRALWRGRNASCGRGSDEFALSRKHDFRRSVKPPGHRGALPLETYDLGSRAERKLAGAYLPARNTCGAYSGSPTKIIMWLSTGAAI